MEEIKSLHYFVKCSLKTVPFSIFLSTWTFKGPPPPNVDNRGHLATPLPPLPVHVVIE